MAKTKAETKPEVVFHGAHLTAAQKAEGVTYTYDWNKVTDPAHLKIRNKGLLEAQEATAASETPTAEGAPEATA